MPEAVMLGTCWCYQENLVPERCQGMRVVLYMDKVLRGHNISCDLQITIFYHGGNNAKRPSLHFYHNTCLLMSHEEQECGNDEYLSQGC